MKNRSLTTTFLFPLLFSIIMIMSLYTIYNYFEAKKRLINDINLDLESTTTQLKDTLPHFISSYAINEYKKIIENQMQDINILAIIVKDYNYGKIFGKEFIESGKIRENNQVIDFDRKNILQQNILENNFLSKRVILKNDSNIKIAEIEVFSTNKNLKNRLNEIINRSLLEILISSIILMIIVLLIIKKSILKPISNIVEIIKNNDKNGIPKKIIPLNGVTELNELVSKMNTMISTIKISKSKIEEINNRFELVLESINEGLWDWNLISNEAYFSLKWKELLGYSDTEIGNNAKYFFDLVHPEDKIKVERALQKYLDNPFDNNYSLEIRMRNKQGNYIWILTRGKAILNKDKVPYRILGTHSDITLRKELEKQILKEKDFISAIIDNSNAMIAVINSDGTMFKVNKYTEDFTGCTQEEIAKSPYFWLNFVSTNMRDRSKNIINDAKNGYITKYSKSAWISKNGERKVFEWSNSLVLKENGEMDYIASIGIDITEREMIQTRILEQKQEFELIFNYSKDGIAILDLETKFIKFNDSFLEMTAFTKKILLEKKLFEFIAIQNMEKNRNILNKVISKGYISNYEETFIFNKKRVIVNLSLSLLPDKKRFLMVIKDVSSLKIMQEQAKLASLGEMIGNIAHQWRQPLSFISTSASALKVKSEFGMLNKEDIEEFSNAIVKQTIYLSNTIDNFRDFIKEDKTYSDISIKDVLDNTLNLVHASLHNNFINLILDLNDDLKILGNKNELTEAFLNIISNSKDALKEKNEEDRFLFIKTKKLDKNRLELEFLDSGGGIDESIISKVLEPYFTTKHKSQGTGLGLAIVNKIIRERHNGMIEIFNQEFTHNQKQYKGICFSIVFEKK